MQEAKERMKEKHLVTTKRRGKRNPKVKGQKRRMTMLVDKFSQVQGKKGGDEKSNEEVKDTLRTSKREKKRKTQAQSEREEEKRGCWVDKC